MLRQFLRLIGARETLWPNHPLSGYYLVTETYTTDIPAPDGPQGLDGGVTLRISYMITQGGGGAKYDAAKAEAIVPQVPYSSWDMECLRTMFQTGKVHQVAREMKRLGLAILGISETRWTGT